MTHDRVRSDAESFDVIVMGGGPAGATAALTCLQEGLSVAIVERSQGWGTHLPETWVGGCAWLLDELGVQGWQDQLQSSTKVTVRSSLTGTQITLTVSTSPDSPQGSRIDRVAFDRVLLDAAQQRGAHLMLGQSVEHIDPGITPAITIVEPRTKQSQTLRAKFLVDATGKSSVLARQHGWIEQSTVPLDPRTAVFTHVRPVASGPLTEPSSMTIVSIEQGYLFVIPIVPERVSLGVVTSASHPRSQLTPAEHFAEAIKTDAEVAGLLAGGEQLLPVIPALNHVYRATKVAASWFALAGEAAAFHDPFLSSSLDFALASGNLAGHTARCALDPRTRFEAEKHHQKGLMALESEYCDAAGHRLLDAYGDLLQAITDPHLPPLLPLAVHGRIRGGDPRDALDAARRDFAATTNRDYS